MTKRAAQLNRIKLCCRIFKDPRQFKGSTLPLVGFRGYLLNNLLKYIWHCGNLEWFKKIYSEFVGS